MTGIPTWLVSMLSAKGLYNEDGISRAAKLGKCPDCRAAVMHGLDGDRAAAAVMTTPYEIDRVGEVIAILLGLHTFTLTQTAGPKRMVWNIDPRNPWAIAAGQRTPLVAEHRCGALIPPAVQPFRSTSYRSPNSDDTPPY